ncbi:hypothetical protein L249_8986 [Ophiocordyceps polyrhachis-furcata BCC 54312]|uniref:CCHC-type domain-containing protein n=1 Tax=Ophiocordyceps polyrhachis-furcata BCC 54312 TaxID=1330021 RepID=A0A367L1Y8_9HYPO|nr:hypothetical protein L249_8986 [Ophiocordyceps polyrhachis-furcata BCC 54312]
MHIKTASEAWNRLKELYNPVSFTSNFLLTKELLEMGKATPYNIEAYLNRIKAIEEELKAREIKIPEIDLRNNEGSYNLGKLFAYILDEAKRYKSNHLEEGQALFTGTKKPWKKQKKALKCSYCKLPGHFDKDCYFLHPEKAPKHFKVKESNKITKRPRKEKALRKTQGTFGSSDIKAIEEDRAKKIFITTDIDTAPMEIDIPDLPSAPTPGGIVEDTESEAEL